MKMNTQARVKSLGQVYYWESYGDVTHQAAAEKHATRHPFSYLIVETRWEGKDTVFPHEVVRRTGFDAKPLRGESNE